MSKKQDPMYVRKYVLGHESWCLQFLWGFYFHLGFFWGGGGVAGVYNYSPRMC